MCLQQQPLTTPVLVEQAEVGKVVAVVDAMDQQEQILAQ
jgi:hypothetical protein